MYVTFPFLSKDISYSSAMDCSFSLLFARLVYCSAFLRLRYCSKQSPNCRGFYQKQFTTHSLYMTPANWLRLLSCFCHFGFHSGREALMCFVIFLAEGKEPWWNLRLYEAHLTYSHTRLGQSKSDGSGSRPPPQGGPRGEGRFSQVLYDLALLMF